MRTEEKPMIARDESLRAAAASLHAAADALLAALSPAPSPAATPAAWVPSVGDVVTWGTCRTVCRVEDVTDDYIRVMPVATGDVWVTAHPFNLSRSEATRMGLRRATSSERAVAGLPADESATKPVDRVALAKVLYVARWPDENPAKLDSDSQHLDGWLRTADAAIRFFKARGGAS